MEVVVVFPCVPLIAILSLNFDITYPRSSALVIIFIFFSLAAINSGLSLCMAAVYTNKSISSLIFSFFCPTNIFTPLSSRSFVLLFAFVSEPLTSKFFSKSTLASPLILIPPIPQKYMCFISLNLILFKRCLPSLSYFLIFFFLTL